MRARGLSASTVHRVRLHAMDVAPMLAAAVFTLGVVAEVAGVTGTARDLLHASAQSVHAWRCRLVGSSLGGASCAPGVPEPDAPSLPFPHLAD